MNSWSHSVQATLRIYPSKEALGGRGGVERRAKTVGLGAADFRLSADGLSVDTNTLKIECLEEGAKYRLFYKTKEGGGMGLDAVFVTGATGACQIGDGFVNFGPNEEDGWVKSKFIPQGTCSGSFTTGKTLIEFSGATGCGINAVTHLPQLLYQWNFFNIQNDTNSIILYQGTLARKHHCMALLVLDNKLVSVLLTNKTTYHSPELDDFSGHKVPKSISHRLSGTCLETQQPVLVTIHIPLLNMMDKIDVLGELPYLVRVFIQTFITAPFCYQWLDGHGEARVEIGGNEARVIRGKIFNETSFLAEPEVDLYAEGGVEQ